MSHVDFDMIYELAECVEEEIPFSPEGYEAMRHIAQCQQCYEAFCSMAAVMAVTSDAGYLTLLNGVLTEAKQSPLAEAGRKVLAVISVAVNSAKESLSVMMEQVGDMKEGFIFDTTPAFAVRDAADGECSALEKIEEIENEYTYVIIDPDEKILLIQIDAKSVGADGITAYLLLEEGRRVYISIEKQENVYYGKLNDIPDGKYQLIMEE